MRMTAEDRRAAIVHAALTEFAAGGYDGTTTESIARRVGISQPYLFRLFPTKKSLFLATVQQGFARIAAAFEKAANGLTGEAALQAMGAEYERLLSDRQLLLVQLQAYAACDDPEIRDTTRAEYRRLWELVERVSGAPAERLVSFFASGMLMNVAAAMDLGGVDEGWAQLSCNRGCPVDPP
jgi:AcrR family transcriptional regulator